MIAKVSVQAGICGFESKINAQSEDSQNVIFNIETNCDKIKELAGLLPEVDAYTEIMMGFDGELYGAIRQHLKGCCSGCAVGIGIFKAMQVAAGLALPKDVTISIVKE